MDHACGARESEASDLLAESPLPSQVLIARKLALSTITLAHPRVLIVQSLATVIQVCGVRLSKRLYAHFWSIISLLAVQSCASTSFTILAPLANLVNFSETALIFYWGKRILRHNPLCSRPNGHNMLQLHMDRDESKAILAEKALKQAERSYLRPCNV